MKKKTKIIISGIVGFFAFPVWLYTLYLIFFDKSKDVAPVDPKNYAFPNNFKPTYSHFFGDSVIAVDDVSDQIHMASKGVSKTYPFSSIRDWEKVVYKGGHAGGVGLAAGAQALGAHNQNKRQSGLFLTVKDVDHPRWQIMFPYEQIEDQLARWTEILRQSVNKDS
jgi:hypothetical protein